jgi:hypothetical protein
VHAGVMELLNGLEVGISLPKINSMQGHFEHGNYLL